MNHCIVVQEGDVNVLNPYYFDLFFQYGNPPEKVSYENLLPAAYQVKTLQDLHSFFATLSFDYVFGEKTAAAAELENEIEMDFIE